ncbi:type II toxin-antitoxin system RelE/ParE family toxin [Rhizobium sp. NRK18]|uniref:type II toxin-antitoxin system RelE/ParE family toxin n=1 Tax=Rhizobium sp. NRK18 TaxID=2964667 RepID=UPI0021C4BC5B|nr:type II toxin-antitoxin system RelE/ParE family toxin [Rhizobium sp. NRK18]MCQ2006360.1 type II toxin-antitoxin system RelE/ParE family toxin [Rhizobium sp. NRK18]
MTKVRLSRKAADYIRREAEYLHLRNPPAARTFSLAMKKARNLLDEFPETGNHMHGLQIAGGRTLVVGDYLLDYLYDGKIVDVLTIRHARMIMQTPDVALDKDLDDSSEEQS